MKISLPLLPKTSFRFRLRFWLYGAGGVIVIGALAWLLRPAPVAVDVATIESEELSVMIIEEGRTRIRERYVVSAPVSGYLQRLQLEEGDVVQSGQAIAQIDPLTLDSEVQSILAQIDALKAEKTGVATLRPKSTALDQADANIAAAQAQISAVSAQLEELEARLNQARQDRQRAEFLQEQGAISQQDLEAAQLNETAIAKSVEAARQNLNSAQADLASAQALKVQIQAEQADPDYLLGVYDAQIRSLEASLVNQVDQAQRTEITTPTSGQVLRIHKKSQQYIEAGAPVLEVGDRRQLELVVDVLSSDATQIEPGDQVLIDQWGGDRPLDGRVKQIEPAAFTKVSALGVEEQRVNVIIDFAEVPANLGDQYRVEAQIIVWQQEALQIPISALSPCEEGQCVFVVRQQCGISLGEHCIFAVGEQYAQRTPIEVGQRTGMAAQVTSGLDEGDQVILYPSERIQPGSRIKFRE